ncbi:phosphate acetyltransferase [Rhodococcus sp. 06-1059B-a]|nr:MULTISPECIES: phosphate acetyltransferase [unclassified Rhodococcus (in: high G+C Gram-positive bacteria)]OZC86181.1 phosphate acetyltransferase [Rhodococcus sp. 06-418-1B]OZD59238.1 phosphate acetyltransferase [Rhodococcus sp. 06-1059B-a]
MSDLEYLATLLAGLDAEIARVAAADSGSDEQSSAIDDAVDAVLRLRAKVKAGYPGKKAYYIAASTDPNGIRVEGISALQGKRAHELVRDGGWMHTDSSTVLDLLDDDQISRYRAVAGRGVTQTFRDAREYLAAATGLADK